MKILCFANFQSLEWIVTGNLQLIVSSVAVAFELLSVEVVCLAEFAQVGW